MALINYAVIAETSIADQLLSAIIPGLLTAFFICIYAFYTGKKRNYGGGEKFSFQNFIDGWKSAGIYTYATYFINSFIMVIPTTLLTIASSALVAYGFARFNFPFKKQLFAILIATLMLPNSVIIIPRYVLFNKFGWVDSYMPFWVPALLACYPFFIYQLIQFMRGIPRDLDEAATIDGCSKYKVYSHIILPLMKPSIVTTVIIQFYWKWDDYLGPLLYLSRPQSYTVSIAIKLFADSASTTDYGAMFAMSTLSLIPVFLIFLFFNRYLVQGIGTSGLKG